jgi:hypothetical protein
MTASSPFVTVGFGTREPLVIVEGDRPFGDVEDKLTIGAVIILPAAMRAGKKGKDHMVDGIANSEAPARRIFRSPLDRSEFDFFGRKLDDDIVAGLGFDVLDLAAVAIAIKNGCDGRDSRLRKRIEQRCLVFR